MSQASDGMLRVLALVALLLQSEETLPDVMILDEPELGLHPYAINIIFLFFPFPRRPNGWGDTWMEDDNRGLHELLHGKAEYGAAALERELYPQGPDGGRYPAPLGPAAHLRSEGVPASEMLGHESAAALLAGAAQWCREYARWRIGSHLPFVEGYPVESWAHVVPPFRRPGVLFRVVAHVEGQGETERAERLRRRALLVLLDEYASEMSKPQEPPAMK